ALRPREEVRARSGLLERVPRADERDGVGTVGADERVEIRPVDLRIRRGERRLTVTGREARGRREPGEEPGQKRGRADHRERPVPQSGAGMLQWSASARSAGGAGASWMRGGARRLPPPRRPGRLPP